MQANSPADPLVSSDPQTAEEAVVLLLMQAGRRLRTRHPEDQVEPSCFPLARLLLHHAEGMRVSDIAAQIELDVSTVSRQIKQLEDKGMLQRTQDPADGRASLIQLSEHGRSIMIAGFRRRLQRIKAVLDGWSAKDRDQLRSLVTRLASELATAGDQAAAEAAADDSTARTQTRTHAPGVTS